MVNPLWIWRAIQGKSITFAALCGMALLGASVFSWLRAGAAWLGASGIIVWIFPIALSAVIASKEIEWVPSSTMRKKLAWGLFIAAATLAIALRLLAKQPTHTL